MRDGLIDEWRQKKGIYVPPRRLKGSVFVLSGQKLVRIGSGKQIEKVFVISYLRVKQHIDGSISAGFVHRLI